MIACPNCHKENADESLHCGFCGQKLQEDAGGKKTMFGLNALNADDIKRAAEDAKAAAAQAAQGAAAAAPSLNTPSFGEQDDDAAFARTEMMPSITPEDLAAQGDPTSTLAQFGAERVDAGHPLQPAQPAGPADPFAADFAALEQNFGSSPEEPVDPTPSGSYAQMPSQPASSGFGGAPAPSFPSTSAPSNPGDFSMGSAEAASLQGPSGPQSFGAPQSYGGPSPHAQPNPGMLQHAHNQQLAPQPENKKLIVGLVIGGAVLIFGFILILILTIVFGALA